MNIVDIAREQAFKAHEDVGHLYDGKPYNVHLIMSQVAAHKFAYLVPEEDILNVIAAVLHHDTIEDCGITKDELEKMTNEKVAKIVQAVTNQEGLTRKERANDKYYEGIRNTKYATFVKLCDRIANVLYSVEAKNRMLNMYRKEHEHFKDMLYTTEYDDMWKFLDFIISK